MADTPNWQQPEQLEAVNTKTGEVVFPIVPDMKNWPDCDGHYLVSLEPRDSWRFFDADGKPVTSGVPYRIRNRAETAETVRAEFDAYKREVSEAISYCIGQGMAGHHREILDRFIQVPSEPVDPLVEQRADTIFRMIAHGDAEHREWLRQKSYEVAEAIVTQERGLTITQAQERGE